MLCPQSLAFLHEPQACARGKYSPFPICQTKNHPAAIGALCRCLQSTRTAAEHCPGAQAQEKSVLHGSKPRETCRSRREGARSFFARPPADPRSLGPSHGRTANGPEAGQPSSPAGDDGEPSRRSGAVQGLATGTAGRARGEDDRTTPSAPTPLPAGQRVNRGFPGGRAPAPGGRAQGRRSPPLRPPSGQRVRLTPAFSGDATAGRTAGARRP